ncbi:hypothetical protein ACHWGL_30270, partial [Klebsiella pneumoniae]|uniref:hypothetical protein n=1 Tax=Klebsiella pneumoniae TaxID=573 RepID=UPI00376EE572
PRPGILPPLQACIPANLKIGAPNMRNPLKRHPTADAKPTLRERFASMKAKAVGLAAETSQGRRTMLAGSVAATMPLPALAASAPVAAPTS